MSYTDPETRERYIPWIVETLGGVDRTFQNLLLDAYEEEAPIGNDKKGRTVLRLHPWLAPIKVAVLTLQKNKEELVTIAKELHAKLRRLMVSQHDDVANIGRRYRRQDEIGTPFCVTVDFTTLEDQTVTVRERDSMSQIRQHLNDVPAYLLERAGWDYSV